VFRPADAVECAGAWTYAVTREHGPSALVFSRHKLPALERPAGWDPKQMLKGAYVLSDTKDANVVLLATGSEVGIAAGAAKLLAADGWRPRVVSAPCWNAFERLPQSEQDAVLGKDIPRVAIEAGRSTMWHGVVGRTGIVVGIDRFGASAPYERIAEELGFTPEKVAARVKSEIEKR
jgi:transketolase